MTIYRERLWPAVWLYFATALIIPATFLALFPINLTVAVATAAVLYAGIVAALLLNSPVVEVTNEEFRAAKAHLPLAAVGSVEQFTGEDAAAERGRLLDARAWLAIRSWVGPVVKVEVADERDATPYWIVSTRHPEAVANAIAKAKAGTN